jgi:hypothetical protein
VPWIPTLPVGGFSKRNKYLSHPAIGFKVVITGRHPLHGYHAVIREIVHIDDMGPLSFGVEVDARSRLETIDRKNLAIRS